MKFRTAIPIPIFPFQISFDDRIMSLGSCFSEHTANFLSDHRFCVHANPFGILFNPLSISLSINLLIKKEKLSDNYFQFFEDKWVSFAHHGKFSHSEKQTFSYNIQNQLAKAQDDLHQATILFITFGTAFYYYHKEKKIVVANCHKIPQAAFEKRCASIGEIVDAFHSFFEWKKRQNPDLKVIFTVSPVRHLGDGFHENTLSKSILHLAVEELLRQDNCFYFPSYEIFNDDLRDYRFYEKDLCHPSAQGIEFMQEILLQSLFPQQTRQQIQKIAKENKMLNHRALYSE